MIDPPQIVQTLTQPAAVIHLRIPKAQIRTVMGAGLGELRAALQRQGVASPGAWFTHHLQMLPDVYDFEIALPVTVSIQAMGRVSPGELPAGRIARTVYQGPYDGLGAGWNELATWLAAQGHTPALDFWEVYLVGPESDPEPMHWRTELNRPLVGDRRSSPT